MPMARPISRMVGGPWVVIEVRINAYILSCRSLLGACLISSFPPFPKTQECFACAVFRTPFQIKHTIRTVRRQDNLSTIGTLLFWQRSKMTLPYEYPMSCEHEGSFERWDPTLFLGMSAESVFVSP